MKLIVAVLRKEDEVDTIAELNKKGFFVTELATTGGFLKEKNTTLLIGTDDHKLDAVLAILKQEAGLRKTVTYAATPMESGNFCPGGNYSVPIDTQTGGCTVFVLNMEQLEKYDIDYGETGASDENADVVRIMSIHQSKGLEFPVVFIPKSGKHFHSCSSHSYIIIVIKKHIIVKSNRRKKEKYLKNPSAFFRIFGTLFLFHIQYQMTWQTIYHNRLIITLN